MTLATMQLTGSQKEVIDTLTAWPDRPYTAKTSRRYVTCLRMHELGILDRVPTSRDEFTLSQKWKDISNARP